MKKVNFLGTECDVVLGEYDNGRKAIQLVENGCPFATASINKPDMDIAADQVIIKDYSENKGMVKALQDAGIVQPLYPWPLGKFGSDIWVCQII
jgi:hypothetical protein